MNQNKYKSRIDELVEFPSSNQMILSAVKEILPKRDGGKLAFIISLILGISLSLKIGIDKNTISLTLSTVQTILNVLIGVFGCVFAVYSILLAFLSDSYVKKLLEIDYDSNSSYLKTSTTYYESVLFLFFISIVMTAILELTLGVLKPNSALTSNNILNNFLAVFFLSIYFSFVFRVLYEIKSTIYNTVVLFRTSIAFKILAFAKKEKEDENNDNN